MRLAFVTRKTDLKRINSYEPEAYVLLDPIEIPGKTLFPEELEDYILVLEEAPLGILDDLKGSLEMRDIVFSIRPKYAIFPKPDVPGIVKIEGIRFVNASRGAVIDTSRNLIAVPYRRRTRILYRVLPDTPRGIPQVFAGEPARIWAYREYNDPHLKRVAMFARAYMENRIFVWEPIDRSLIELLESLENPVFFDLEFDARALRKGFRTDEPIIRVASILSDHLEKFFIRTIEDERKFLERLSQFDTIIGYGTFSDEKILAKAAKRYGIDVPKVIDLMSIIFPNDPKKQRIAIPSGRKRGLKAVAESLGFRRSSDKDGYRAFKTYLIAKKYGRKKSLVEELIRYNVEDTLMTGFVFKKIKEALRELE